MAVFLNGLGCQASGGISMSSSFFLEVKLQKQLQITFGGTYCPCIFHPFLRIYLIVSHLFYSSTPGYWYKLKIMRYHMTNKLIPYDIIIELKTIFSIIRSLICLDSPGCQVIISFFHSYLHDPSGVTGEQSKCGLGFAASFCCHVLLGKYITFP